MDCQPLNTAKKNKEQIHKAELVHISIVNNNQNNQLLVEVCALMFKKILCTHVYQISWTISSPLPWKIILAAQ